MIMRLGTLCRGRGRERTRARAIERMAILGVLEIDVMRVMLLRWRDRLQRDRNVYCARAFSLHSLRYEGHSPLVASEALFYRALVFSLKPSFSSPSQAYHRPAS